MRVSDAFPSKYLKAEDLKKKEIIVTIESVQMETIGSGDDSEEKPVLYFKGAKKALALTKTNALTIAMILDEEEMNLWVGKQIMLHTVMTTYKGQPCLGIRVRQAPGANQDTTASRNNPFTEQQQQQNDPSEIFSEDPDGEEPPF